MLGMAWARLAHHTERMSLIWAPRFVECQVPIRLPSVMLVERSMGTGPPLRRTRNVAVADPAAAAAAAAAERGGTRHACARLKSFRRVRVRRLQWRHERRAAHL
jgi:hypothetical protein